jgi:hypothetical protein
VLRTRLVADVAISLDAALFTGTGASNTIKGIVNQLAFRPQCWTFRPLTG